MNIPVIYTINPESLTINRKNGHPFITFSFSIHLPGVRYNRTAHRYMDPFNHRYYDYIQEEFDEETGDYRLGSMTDGLLFEGPTTGAEVRAQIQKIRELATEQMERVLRNRRL